MVLPLPLLLLLSDCARATLQQQDQHNAATSQSAEKEPLCFIVLVLVVVLLVSVVGLLFLSSIQANMQNGNLCVISCSFYLGAGTGRKRESMRSALLVAVVDR